MINLVVLLICVTPICFGQTDSDCVPPGIISCDPRDKFRSFDGTCNNLEIPTAGSKYAPLISMITSERDAGKEPQRETLKDPQEISNKLSRADISAPYDSELTEMVLAWGQFITNDITVVPETAIPQDCNGVSAFIDGSNVYGEDMNILLDAKKADRPHYFNGLSAYIVASNVYGENNLLDTEKTDPRKVKIDKKRPFGVPSQANQMEETDTSGASGLPSLFEREHERVEEGLKKVNKSWRSERYYNTTRAIVGAILQKITIEEYLPTLIGPLPEYKPKNHSYAGIYNAFASAAYRVGHPLQTNSQPLVDTKSKRSLTDVLTQKMSTDVSMDGTALYIQRDRNTALPSYNALRQACGHQAYNGFGDMPDHSENNGRLLMEAYVNVDDIEFLPGGITEKRLPNSLFGPVFKCIMERQFQLLRDGDRFWYQTSDPVTGFSTAQLAEIKKMTLAKIMCKNENIKDIQPDVFRVVNNRDNQLTPCRNIPDMDLSVFQEGEN